MPAALAQHYVAGRDFYFAYGPLSQVITWLGVRLHTPWSPIDSLPLILFVLGTTATVLMGISLAFLRDLDAKACIFIYACAAALNLFSEPTSFRVLILILSATLIYRGLISRSSSAMLKWMTAAGSIAVIGQLLTVELGIYAIAAAVPAIALHTWRKSRIRDIFPCYGALIGTYDLGNVVISTAFALSAHGHRFFDYQLYSFDLIRGFNYTEGIPWGFTPGATVVLAVVTLFTLASTVWLTLKAEYSALLAPLLTVSLVTVKSAVTRSDIGHIAQSSSPLIFTFIIVGYLFLREKRTRYTVGLVWTAIFVAVFVTWPWSSRYALVDLKNAATHSPLRKIAQLRTTTADPVRLLPAELAARPLQSQTPLLPFPHEDDIPVVLHRPTLAPVFQSHQASMPSLQQFYVRQMDKMGNNLEVVYGVNSNLDGVQSISRVPPIFEYLYRNFVLTDDREIGCGFCVLKRTTKSFELKTNPVNFQVSAGNGSVDIRPNVPASCSFLKLNLRIDYSLARFIGHIMPLDVTVAQARTRLMNTRIVPIDVNKTFSTYVSLIPPDRFYSVFQHTSTPQFLWDTLRIESRKGDWADVTPSSIHVDGVDCVTM